MENLVARKHGVLLERTESGFENEGVFNPACIREGNFVHMFYRAVREGNFSSIGYCRLKGPMEIAYRKKKPLIVPEKRYESQGIEDPRITKIEDLYYLTYSVYDNINVMGAYATSQDLKKFTKQKVITPRFTYREYKHFIECSPNLNEKYLFHYRIFKEHGLGPEVSRKLYLWDKNIMFFPRKIKGQFAMIHRIHPGIQIAYFDDFKHLTKEYWQDYLINLEQHIAIDPELPHESSHIGGGAPPIETEHGWLLIYHTVEDTPRGFVYRASAALLDLEDPRIEIARLPQPLISPQFRWEKEGIVNNIIFPTGTALFDDELYIYYGAADEHVAAASVNLPLLLATLMKNTKL